MTGLLRKVRFLEQHELRPGYDVVIVGGGVNGLSLAYHLAEVHGIRDVVAKNALLGGALHVDHCCFGGDRHCLLD